MHKYPCFLLVSPDTPAQPAGARWGRGATLVLGRQLCVHFVLDATGVPRSGIAGFVTLQAMRLAPYAQFGGAYVRQGTALHVWVWPQEVVGKALAALAAQTGHWRVLPESLWGTAPQHGTVLRPSAAGFEALRFEGGLLREAIWWPQAPEANTLAEFAAGTPVVHATDSALGRVQGGQRWARTAHAVPQAGMAAPTGVLEWLQKPVALVMAGWVCVAAAAGYTAWVAAQGYATEQQKTALQAKMDSLLAHRATATKGQEGAATAADEQWVRDVRRLVGNLQFGELLSRLTQPLASRGLLIRELVMERDEVKLTLVSGYNGPVDLDEAVGALEGMGLWQRVELLDLNNPAQVRFGLKPSAAKAEQP